MKRTKSLFEKIVSFDNLRLAWLKARRGKTASTSVTKFSKYVGKNLETLRQRMLSEPPVFSEYSQFKINDPKERIISVVPFSARVIHHAIMNVLEDVFEKQFVFHTYACRKNKGSHAAARYAFKKAKSSRFFLKLDVRKYFDNINHLFLKNQLSRIIKDDKCLSLLFSIIDGYSSSDSKKDEKGLPIGNLTSQFFANLYLSSFDHFVLEKLSPTGYARYMDDIVVFENSMEKLHSDFEKMSDFCGRNLALSFKDPIFGNTKQGIPFLGWRITKHGIFLLAKTKRRMKEKLIQISKDSECGFDTPALTERRVKSVFASRKIDQFGNFNFPTGLIKSGDKSL